MSFGALVFFFLFVATLVVSYIALRRRMAPPAYVSAACVLGSIVFMMLFSLAQGTLFLHALLVGFLVGGLFAGALLAVALYFQGNEMRKRA
jgi:hypothetical protein